jgi:hypothetical protein
MLCYIVYLLYTYFNKKQMLHINFQDSEILTEKKKKIFTTAIIIL